MSKFQNILLGSDPEVFLKSKTTGEFISGIGKIGGSKQDPRPLGNNFFIQEDNVLAEFNIPPSASKDSFVDNINTGIKLVENEVAGFAEIAIVPYAFFNEKELKGKQAQEFGCDPDLSCWSLAENPAPCATNKTLRTASGHISIGYDNPKIELSQKLGQALDLFLSVRSSEMSDELPRRELYGKMGAIRFKDWGVEYRTPSNFWLTSSDRVFWAYEQTMRAIDFVENNRSISTDDYYAMLFAIDEGNPKAIKYLTDQYNLEVA
jgi:hypothetical protein